MNSLTNLNKMFIPNTLDGINIISEEIETNALLVDGSNKMLSNLNMNTHQIKNLGNATLTNDAVNLGQLYGVSSASTIFSDNVSSSSFIYSNTVSSSSKLYSDMVGNDVSSASFIYSNTVSSSSKLYVDAVVNNASSASKIYIDAQDNLRVLKTGDTMTGTLLFSGYTQNAFNSSADTGQGKHENYYNGDWYQVCRASSATKGLILRVSNNVAPTSTHDRLKITGDGTTSLLGPTTYIAGNVGVGTTTPAQKLDVNGSASIANNFSVLQNVSIGSSAFYVPLYVNGEGVINGRLSTNDKLNCYGDFYVSGTSTLNGNLNVSGTSTMNGNLDVFFNNATLNIKAGNENQNSTLYLSTPYPGFNTKKTAIIAKGITNNSRADLLFCLNSAVNNTTEVSVLDSKMAILNNGNVGIGTTAPNNKLQVAGAATIDNNLIVSGTSSLGSTSVNDVLYLSGGTVSGDAGADFKTNTYIRLAPAGSSNDWMYLRQIGGDNAYHLAFDFHDDANDGKVSFRNIESTANPDTVTTFFTASAIRGFYNPRSTAIRPNNTTDYELDNNPGVTVVYAYGGQNGDVYLPNTKEIGMRIEIINQTSTTMYVKSGIPGLTTSQIKNGPTTTTNSSTLNAGTYIVLTWIGGVWVGHRVSGVTAP